jgi:hypothetical protein
MWRPHTQRSPVQRSAQAKWNAISSADTEIVHCDLFAVPFL